MSIKDTQTHGFIWVYESQPINTANQRKYIASDSKQSNSSRQCQATNSSSSPVSISQKPTNLSSSSTGARVHADIFEGVTRKCNARYYISGISQSSTELGMTNFLKDKDISVSLCVFFKTNISAKGLVLIRKSMLLCGMHAR